ncbi:MAG: AAA family ATPase [Hormoscilla sp.]
MEELQQNLMKKMTLAGYQITDLIYEGTRTQVYRGFKNDEEKPVVLKKLRQEYPSFKELVQFRHQYILSKNLDLPGIIKAIALEKDGNGYVLVMEDVGGVSLSEYVGDRPLGREEFLQVALALSQILEDLYRNRVIHKDIKPANILINPETKEIFLIDFSISSLLPRETQEIQNPNILEGTLAYISPEQTGRMNRGIDYRSDFYSLGVTFYQLLTGELPFKSDDPMELVHCHIAKTPIPPHAVKPEIPQALSALVMKLMAKTAEERYQSARGIKQDLEKCWQQWQETGSIAEFELGERDISDRFCIPEKLYGREAEVQTLLDAFDRVGAGTTEMMLVAGFSGIGKTVVVNEVHKPIVRQRGYFIKGKFDQFQRNIPFSALVQAFRDLMEQLQGESDPRLEMWKMTILNALGENSQVIIEVIPELERIIGKQPPAIELSGSAATNRFNLLFGKFIRVFTTPDHPLVIFLDDLQWADSASLKLMQLLMEDSETGYLLLLGAYRDNEMFPAHPLMLSLDEIAKLGATVNTITLAPLNQAALNPLVADTLCCSLELGLPLTKLVYQKTKGNPFFATQFLKSLHEDGWIEFNFALGHWQCNMTQIRQLALTDDVVEFMATRLHKLPEATQEILKLAACIGNQFDLETMAIVSGESQLEVAENLWVALQEGLVLPQSQIYKLFSEANPEENALAEGLSVGYNFLHDRVQQAAYTLIPDEQKQATHYQIGQLLLQNIPPDLREERIFGLVSQLNYGTALITEQSKRDFLAELNLIACRKARAATAYQGGREYASIGLSLLGEQGWSGQYNATLAFHNLAAELAMLCGDFEAMEEFADTAIARSRTVLERVHVCRTRIFSKLSQNQQTEALEIALGLLQQLGVTFPDSPTEKDVGQAIAEIQQLIGDRPIKDLIRLPRMTDEEKIAIVQISNSIAPAAYITGASLFPFLICLPVKLSIQYGNTPASGFAYSSYSILACNLLRDVNTGVDFAELALQLADQLNALDAKAIKSEVFATAALFAIHRRYHAKETLQLPREGYTTSLEVGNLDFAGRNASIFCINAFWCGQALVELEKETRAYCNGLVQLKQLATANYCRICWQAILNLLEPVERPNILSGEALQETKLLPHLIEANDFFGLFFFYLYKLVLAYLFEDIESARHDAAEIKRYFAGGAGLVGEPAFYFYDSLIVLASLNSHSEEITEAFERVAQNQSQLQEQWASYAPMNYQHKVDLVAGERCRVLGQNLEAIELYDRALAGAKANEYIQEEALANELFAKFYLDWGREKEAAVYMQEAYYCYARWGAKAKIEDLETRYPHLLSPILQRQQEGLIATATLATMTQGTLSKTTTGTGELLDLDTLMKASRTLSENIELERAIANLMQVAMENAGAETAALMLFEEEVLMLSALVCGEEAPQIDPIPVENSNAVPLSIVNKVKRTGGPIALDNASNETAYAGDAYIQQYQPKSILCLPLVDRRQLIGILYLENNRVAGAFTGDRVEVLTLLCSQAAISLENARLYRESRNYSQQLEQTQLQLVQSEKMASIGELAAGVAHEINNPVGFISGNLDYASEYIEHLAELLQLYQQGFAYDSETIQEKIEEIELDDLLTDFRELLGSMKSGTNRITEISKSMRTFSRADTAAKVAFNIHDGIDSTLLILKHRLKANKNRPEIEIIKNYGNLPEVNCYPGQLNQVFMNLIANAIDAFEEGNIGRSFDEIKADPNRIAITTEFHEAKELVIVRIKDNGMGMNEEVKAKVFQHLFTTKGVGKGTGLGLSISRQIAEEKHGGKMTLTSEPGKGAEFAIALPLT